MTPGTAGFKRWCNVAHWDGKIAPSLQLILASINHLFLIRLYGNKGGVIRERNLGEVLSVRTECFLA